ncbi:MAG: MlaD family protein [Syntrophales bacterium]|jgi:phospholipid/cholesterol/gamma-HCH transport system substrate-binding protein|nr:MlaD family protein [Syntrophales bacterium]MDD4339680.1 MlaD family protein [Syntrophales bacterium]HOG06941.1 MlaD family protein [Syntrophales bacterium]HOS76792.1 MlaD family protein [Syntrophales bacterium]
MAKNIERKVGLFILITTALIVASVVYIAYKKDVFTPTHTYTLSSKSGDNLTEGMPVVFSGFKIGKVEKLELNDNGLVMIRISVPRRHVKWLRTDTRFVLEKPIISTPRIVVTTTNFVHPLLDEQTVREMTVTSDINEIVKMIQPLLDRVNSIATSVDKLTAALASPQGDLSRTLANAQVLTSKLSQKNSLLEMAVADRESVKSVEQALSQVKDITGQINAILKKVDAMAVKTDASLYGQDGALVSVSKILKDLLAKLQKLETTVDNVNRMSTDAVGATGDLKGLRLDLEATIRSINDLAGNIDRLIPLKKEPEIRLP